MARAIGAGLADSLTAGIRRSTQPDTLEKRLRTVVVKLWVSSQEGVEGGHVSLKPDFGNHGFHVAPYTLDLLQANFMNFIRRQICR